MPLYVLVYHTIPEQLLVLLNIIIPGIIIVTLGIDGINGILLARKMFSRNEKKITEIPELEEFANKKGIRLSSQPFWEKDYKIKAMSDGFRKNTKKIIFASDYLKSLTSEEKIFVAGHEFLHLYGRENFYHSIIIAPIIFFMFYIQSIQNIPPLVFGIGVLGTAIGSIGFTKRSFEFIADINGAINVSKENAINALRKAHVGSEEKLFYLHPSLKARINNLEKYYKQK